MDTQRSDENDDRQQAGDQHPAPGAQEHGAQEHDAQEHRAQDHRAHDHRAQDMHIPPRPPAPQPPAYGTIPPAPHHFAAPGQQGHAFGHAAQNPQLTQPTQPLSHDYRVAATEQEHQPEARRTGGGRAAALLVAAALVGGAAGLGGSYAGDALWGSGGGSGSSSGPSSITVNNPGSVNEATAVATEVLPSVVTISVADRNGSGSGSGVVLSEDGYVVTNTHVVTLGGATNDAQIRVTASDGRIYEAELVGTDPIYDLAVIKLADAEGLTPIEFADSSELNVGATTVAVGAPLGLSNTVTTGIVSALNRSIEIASAAAPEEGDQAERAPEEEQESPWFFDIPGQEEAPRATESISIAVIQTDAAINPGNSGGALVDSEGRLIGVNVAIATASGGAGEAGSIGVGFAIPSNVVERVTQELIENGVATHGLLGASVTPAGMADDATTAGARIEEVTPGGAAEAAGLRAGDVVTEFNGVRVGSAVDLTAQVRAAAGGSDATLTYVRDGEEHELELTLGSLGE